LNGVEDFGTSWIYGLKMDKFRNRSLFVVLSLAAFTLLALASFTLSAAIIPVVP